MCIAELLWQTGVSAGYTTLRKGFGEGGSGPLKRKSSGLIL